MRIAALLLFVLPVCAQTADPTLQSLLAEVHQLRLALERSTLIGPRIQIVVERMKIQQDVVSRLSRQIDDSRREMENMMMPATQFAARMKELESGLLSETDPNRRKALENDTREMKMQMERFQIMEQQSRTRIAELEGRLRSEQANLDVLNDKLNQIERALDKQ